MADCSYDTVTKNVEVETQQRAKRSVDEVREYLYAYGSHLIPQEEWLLEQAAEDDYRQTMEICESDADEENQEGDGFWCASRLNMMADIEDQLLSRYASKPQTNILSFAKDPPCCG